MAQGATPSPSIVCYPAHNQEEARQAVNEIQQMNNAAGAVFFHTNNGSRIGCCRLGSGECDKAIHDIFTYSHTDDPIGIMPVDEIS